MPRDSWQLAVFCAQDRAEELLGTHQHPEEYGRCFSPSRASLRQMPLPAALPKTKGMRCALPPAAASLVFSGTLQYHPASTGVARDELQISCRDKVLSVCGLAV